MPVTITINGENAAQAIEEFTTLSASFTGAGKAAPVEESPKPRQQRKPASTPKEPEEKEEAPEQESDSAETSEPIDAPSVVDLRAKAQEVGKDPANKPKIKALLNKYDSPNISEVPEDKRAAFLADLEAL